MTMNNKLLVLLLFTGWSFLCWRIYVCRIKQVCPAKVALLAADSATPTPAIDGTSTTETPALNASVEETKTTTDQVATEVTENLKDAAQAKPKPSTKPATKNTEISTSAIEGSSTTTGGGSAEDHVTIEETPNEAIIHFPFNSTRKIDNQEMNAYLTKLAARVKASSETVLITGHTDGIGDAQANTKLALVRANSIRDILIKKGVSSKLITTRSFGERKPVASDDTPQGRYRNRRAVLTVQ
jgi:outer membrane protein OmpA-like peptidoglycan-associated protein